MRRRKRGREERREGGKEGYLPIKWPNEIKVFI